MSGSGDIDHVQVVLADEAIAVDVDEIQARCRAPMSQQAGFDVLDAQRLAEQGVVVEIDLAHGQVVRGAPVGVHLGKDG